MEMPKPQKKKAASRTVSGSTSEGTGVRYAGSGDRSARHMLPAEELSMLLVGRRTFISTRTYSVKKTTLEATAST